MTLYTLVELPVESFECRPLHGITHNDTIIELHQRLSSCETECCLSACLLDIDQLKAILVAENIVLASCYKNMC